MMSKTVKARSQKLCYAQGLPSAVHIRTEFDTCITFVAFLLSVVSEHISRAWQVAHQPESDLAFLAQGARARVRGSQPAHLLLPRSWELWVWS